ncbi:MAG: 60S ribosomal protein L4 [Amphiamblys sp. WSBS2006]|nr:MAG: 60S ribosomal protein L4 [Amphiamblys sp. WSBS2006]
MMTPRTAGRPVVSVHTKTGAAGSETMMLPDVFEMQIKPDVIARVHKNVSKEGRQPYAVSKNAGAKTSAESWGTGRAVARIPRVKGSGSGRAGQGAFGNMCRGGRLFGPTKVERRWYAKTNEGENAFAIASAVAATAYPSLVMARGHRVESVPEVPLVISDDVSGLRKTKDAIAFLGALGLKDELARIEKSRKRQAGRSRMRNKTHKQATGPLVCYSEENRGEMQRAFRNIPGVELVEVTKLDVLMLAPGSQIGRLVIWTKSAFASLDKVFGTFCEESEVYKGFKIAHPMVSNPDVSRVLESEEVQSVLKRDFTKKWKNVKSYDVSEGKNLLKLNPHAMSVPELKALE